jgi:hypothetical protein
VKVKDEMKETLMGRIRAALYLLGAVVVSACSVSAQSPPEPSRKPIPLDPAPRADVPVVSQGEVPKELLDKLRANLVQQKRVNASAIKVVSAESVIWPDGALGCGRPGEMVTQATVPGYRVELEADGQRYAYHAAERGFFRLCESPRGKALDREAVK